MEFAFDNVNDAFCGLVKGIHSGVIPTQHSPSRAGYVYRVTEPVCITYQNPKRHVLWNSYRDANPFFHLFEALWMLAGCNDVDSISKYNSNIGKVASDDGLMFNGAYGYRWRHYFDYDSYKIDQIEELIEHLKRKPDSRRGVLQMWNIEDDLMKIEKSKDVCCNTAVYLEIVDGKLNITVTNRSNDLIWGTLGSDYMTFTILQAYLAASIGVEVGVYHQFTNNLHVYEKNWEPEKWLKAYEGEPGPFYYPEQFRGLDTSFLGFNQDLGTLVNADFSKETPTFYSGFMLNIVEPMMTTFELHKQRNYDAAILNAERIIEQDWRQASTEWIFKRKQNWEMKNESAGK